MTASPDPLIPDYQTPKVSRIRIVGRYVLGVVFAFCLMFVAIFFAGAASFEQHTVWWAWPVLALPIVICGAIAYRWRKSRPGHSAGLVTGAGDGRHSLSSRC